MARNRSFDFGPLGYLEPTSEGMSGPPIGGERNFERDALGGIATRGEFEAPVQEKTLPLSEGLASRRPCGY